jgi:hypothetical protein
LISTREEIAKVFEGYRTRWTIEEYFKVVPALQAPSNAPTGPEM